MLDVRHDTLLKRSRARCAAGHFWACRDQRHRKWRLAVPRNRCREVPARCSCRVREHFDIGWARLVEKANRSICFLCRLVFVEKSHAESLRAPRLGALSGVPYESMNPEAWPYLPFAI